MDLFEEIADERRAVADLAAQLSAEQLAHPSLCRGWTVHDVLAHLLMPLEARIPQVLRALLAARGDYDRANVVLTARWARRPADEIAAGLRARATSRFTPPGLGPGAPLTDLVVHGLDIRRPLAIDRRIPPQRLRACLDFLVTKGGRGFVPKGRLDGIRLEAADLGWSWGSGAVVRGPAEDLVLAATGRAAGVDALTGEGAAVLRGRLPQAR